jgi:purine-binding chemotaxis protein CheW
MNKIDMLALHKALKNVNQEEKEENRVIAFLINEELIGIDIKNVIKITKKLDITPVPKTPSHILGVMNLRGNIVPVVNLKQILNLPERDMDDDENNKNKHEFILIIDSTLGNVGLLIDKVIGAVAIKEEEIQPTPISSLDIDSKFTTGVVIVKDENHKKRNLLILLNINKLFEKEEENQS